MIVDTPQGPLAFYRRTGWGSLGEKRAGGAQKGDWAPFEGFYAGQLVKPENLGEGNLRRWSTEQHRAIAQWLKSLNLPKGEDVGDAWSGIQRSLEDDGVPVRYPQYGVGATAPPTPPPEVAGALLTLPGRLIVTLASSAAISRLDARVPAGVPNMEFVTCLYQ